MRNSNPSLIALLGVALAGLLHVAAACADAPPRAGATADPPPAAVAPAEKPPRAGMDNPECRADADCVPAGCCHSTSCVPLAEAPNCEEVACTAECRPGTLDCGGRCVCTADGQCTAKLKDEPSP